MVPALMEAIKSHGLALVIDMSADRDSCPSPATDSRLPKGIDGVLKGSGVLRFVESINV